MPVNEISPQVDQLKSDYDQDTAYFQQLSTWHHNGTFKQRTDLLLQILRPYLAPQAKLLDAGCAAGAMAIELAKAGMTQVDAVDFSPTALRFAHENATRYGVVSQIRFIESKLEQLDDIADNTYDVIVSADVIEHIVEPRLFVREMQRVCKPGGVILIETPNTLFRQHRWYRHIDAACQALHLPASENLFPVDPGQDWGRYHVSLLSWPALVDLLKAEGWEIARETAFGWWLKLGAADRIMSALSQAGALFGTSLRYYANTDVVVVARKPGR